MAHLPLKGKHAVVVGGSSGLGLACATAFAKAGATVAILARRAEKVDAALAQLSAISGGHVGVSVDVRDLRAFPDALEEQHLPQILLNAQGIQHLRASEDIPDELFQDILHVNLTSVFTSSRVVGRRMLAAGSGSIINIASLAAHFGFPLAAPYAASKHGVLGLTKSFAAEWADRGVRVNAISPGYFMTELTEANMKPERKEKALMRTPMQRFGALDELAGAAVFLAGDDASFVTGSVINIDGGYAAAGI